MKTKSFITRTTGLALGMCVVLIVFALSASAATFSGNRCWTVVVKQDESGPQSDRFIMNMHIKVLDTTTYAVYGSMITNRGDSPIIFTGTGGKIGKSI